MAKNIDRLEAEYAKLKEKAFNHHLHKQIYEQRSEMSEIIAQNSNLNGETWDASDFEWAACQLQNAGYGKMTDSVIAKEILDYIMIHCARDVWGDLILDTKKYLDLRKKYLGEDGEG